MNRLRLQYFLRKILLPVLSISLFSFTTYAQTIEDPFYIAALNRAVLKSGSNSLNRRLGDLRRTKESVSSALWVRGYYNNLSKYAGLNFDAAISGVETGFDIRLDSNDYYRLYVGALTGYIGAENFQSANNIKSGAPLFGLYGTWIGANGWFIDATARYFFYKTQDVLSDDRQSWGMTSASLETGKEIKFSINKYSFFMIEPKIECMYGHISGKTTGTINYSPADMLIVHPTVFVGYSKTLINGAIVEPHIECGYNQDFSTRIKVDDASSEVSAGSLDIGGGIDFTVTNIISLWTYVGYEKGNKIENLLVNVGVRIALTGIIRTKKGSFEENYLYSGNESTSLPDGGKRSGITIFSALSSNNDNKNEYLGSPIAPVAVVGSHTQKNSSSQNPDISSFDNLSETETRTFNSSPSIHFAFGKSDITPDSQEYLKAMAHKINNSDKIIELDGHTDRFGPASYNMILSQKRAKAVYDKLIQFGVPASKLRFKGFGFTHPLNREHTKEAATENRRVEFNVAQ